MNEDNSSPLTMHSLLRHDCSDLEIHTLGDVANKSTLGYFITKTGLLKYTENFTTKK